MIEVTLTTGFCTPNMSKKVTLIRRARLLAIPAVGTILTDTDYNVTVRSLRFHCGKYLFADCFEHVIGSDTGTIASNNEELEAAVAAYEHKGWKRVPSEPEPAKLTVAVAMDRLKEEIQENSDCAWAWQCNIAKSIIDEGVDAVTANLAAARFMYIDFDVDVTELDQWRTIFAVNPPDTSAEYREPTEADIGKIIECNDCGPDVDKGNWLKRRLLKINKDVPFPFIAGHTTDTIEEAEDSRYQNCWKYARIENDKQ